MSFGWVFMVFPQANSPKAKNTNNRSVLAPDGIPIHRLPRPGWGEIVES
jgi:hypothetical protein